MEKELGQVDPVSNVYKGGFFKNRHRLSWRAPIVASALTKTFNLNPADHSVVDVGCAIGDYVKELSELGYLSLGIEGSAAAKEFFVSPNISVWDLRKPIEEGIAPALRGIKFDVAFSLEVAEHIETFYSGVYVDNLCTLSDTVLISAATPGQKGHGHVNCAPRNYWIEKFRRRGYVNMKGLEHSWRNELGPWRTKKELSSYIRNVIIFRRQGS